MVLSTEWNDKIVALEKTTWFHFRLMKTGFLFLLQTIYLLASCVQIPRTIGAFHHVWKWHNVQRVRSEMRRCTTHARYRSKLWQPEPLPVPSKCKSGWFNVPRVMKTKFPATVIVFGVVSSEGHIMPPHIFEVGLKVNTKLYLDVLKSVVIPWCNQVAVADPGCGSRTRRRLKSKETQAWLQKECYDFVLFSHWPPPSPNWTRWTTSFGHTLRTSPTWPPTTPKPAWSLPSAEYSPSSRRRLWKRHAPSSGSVSRRWLRLKAATLNRCQLYSIVKLSEFIIFDKSFKIKQ